MQVIFSKNVQIKSILKKESKINRFLDYRRKVIVGIKQIMGIYTLRSLFRKIKSLKLMAIMFTVSKNWIML